MRLRSLLAAGGAVGGLAVLNKRLERHGGDPVDVLGGEKRRYRWNGYDLAYTVAGEGEPLLLVHGVYAGASSFEFRKNFGELSQNFRVYALDLLGCGFSERPRRRYAPEDVTSQVEDFAREEIGAPTHLVASSLSAALSMPAAVRSPKLFKKLVFICPTGYATLGQRSGLLGDAIYGLFLTPVFGDSLYHAIVSRRGIRFYLGRMSYHDPEFVTAELVESYYRTGHQPGAKYLPGGFRLRQAEPGRRGLLAADTAQNARLLGPGGDDLTGPGSRGLRAPQPAFGASHLQRRRAAAPRRAGRDLQRAGAGVSTNSRQKITELRGSIRYAILVACKRSTRPSSL